MRFLVTGATGMLGANLVRHLHRLGHEVRVLVRRPPWTHPFLDGLPVEVAVGDITEPTSLTAAAATCEGLFHVAGQISYLPRDWAVCRRVNVEGTRNILAAAANAGISRAVVTSSTAAVGIPRSGEPPLDENGEFAPQYRSNPYMATKREAESIALAFQGLEVVVVNPSTILGAGDVKMNTGALFQRVAAGRMRWMPPGGISVVGVDDCVEGHWLAWQNGQPGQRYIVSTVNLPLASLIQSIARTLGAPLPSRTLPKWLYTPAYAAGWMHDQFLAGRAKKFSRFVVDLGFRDRYFDSARARDELQWTPCQTVDEMLAQAVKFYRDNGLLPA